MISKARVRCQAPIVIAAILAWSAALPAEDKPEIVTQNTALQWLALVDTGKYGESWEQAATFFKSAVTKDSWIQQVSAAREKTGPLKSRKLKSAQYSESLPNAPAGKYVVIQYDSSFASGPAIETVVPMQEKDGSWKVSGYFVGPGS